MKEHNNNKIQSDTYKWLPLIVPALVFIFLMTGIIHFASSRLEFSIDMFVEEKSGDANVSRFLSSKDLVSTIKDTVYTDKDIWLELFIHKQMLHVHYRDGSVDEYPISTGSKYLHNGVETRPGLFAVFYKNPHHISTQFNSASLYHFMAFNQGIGLHSMDGTGYYSTLGRQPSSRGCIRIAHAPAKKLFQLAELGTIVMAHNGKTSRTVAFAPEGFENEKEYSKEDYRVILARNLHNVLEGNYFTAKRDFVVIDPSVIPVSGVYIGYDRTLPERHKSPRVRYSFQVQKDMLNIPVNKEILIQDKLIIVEDDDEILDEELIQIAISDKRKTVSSKLEYSSAEDEIIVRKYFHNPIGILPYFGPSSNNRPRRVSTSASVHQ